MIRVLIHLLGFALLTVFFVRVAESQELRNRAETAIDALPGVLGVISQSAMEETVTSFETETPPETTLTPEQLENEALLRTQSNTVEGQVFQTQVDSLLGRPEITLDPNIFDVADAAVAGADDLLGGVIDPDEDQCAALSLGPSTDGDFMCHITESDSHQFCSETREISVDRRDDWRCRREAASFLRSCTRDVAYECTGASGPTCLSQNMVFSGGEVVDFGGNLFQLRGVLPEPTGDCQLTGTTFEIEREALITLIDFRLFNGIFDGFGQIIVNGVPVATTTTTGDISLTQPGLLRLEEESCGEQCSETIVYAGTDRLGGCNDTVNNWNAHIDLRPYLPNDAAVVPEITSNAPVFVSMPSRTVEISMLQASTSSYNPIAYLSVVGSCCGSMTAQGDAIC